jgi:hypothetical protein
MAVTVTAEPQSLLIVTVTFILAAYHEGISFYAFYALWIHFPQSGALAEGTSLPASREHDPVTKHDTGGSPI